MMTLDSMPKLFLSVGLVFLLIACTQKSPETNLDPRDTVWGEQVKTLDKARGVEQTLQDGAERARTAETKQTQ